MSFLAPGMLLALGALSAPVVLHFLNKTRTRRMPWAAMRFLRESLERNQRRMRMEDLLLLLLRCLLIVLLASAFAQPVLSAAKSLALPGGSGPVTTVLVIDDSLSMGQSNGVETRFELAKAAAIAKLKEAAPGSECALMFVSDQVRKVIAQPTRDLALVRRNVETAVPGDRASNLLPGIRAAVDSLRKTSGLAREITVITDNQQLAWRDLARIQELREEIKADIAIHFIPVGGEGEANVAVSAVRMDSATPVAGQPVRCAVEVANWGASSVQGLRVTLAWDAEPPSAEGLLERIPPGQIRSLQLLMRPASPGYHTLTASIPPDSLPEDNSRSTAVHVPKRIRVVIVEEASGKRSVDRGGYFLSRVLRPLRSDREDTIQAECVSPVGLTAERLKEADIVILANVSRLEPGTCGSLKSFVEDGGGLMIFPGDSTDQAFFNQDAVFSALLPAKLGAPVDGLPPLALQKNGYTHPVTAIWNDPEAGDLGSIVFNRFFPIDPPGDKITRVLCDFADGRPAIVEQNVGRGNVILFPGPATALWGNLPLHPAFVPLINRIVGSLCSRDQTSLLLNPGAVFICQVGIEHAGEEFIVQRLGGERRLAGVVESAEKTGLVRYAGTERAGAYQVFLGSRTVPVVTFAVQADPAESNLVAIPLNDLALLNEGSVAGNQTGAALAPSARGGETRELWRVFLAGALLVGVAESILAHRASRSH